MLRTILAAALAAAVGCGTENGPGPVPAPKDRPEGGRQAKGGKYLLPSDPGSARGVIAVRKDAKDGEEVVVTGRVGGVSKPISEDRASFLIVDLSLSPESECDCPWAYCDADKKELAAARVTVKVVEAGGRTVPHGARELFGIKELSTVVVKGKVQRDDKDNVVVLASGVYVPEAK